MYFPIQAVAAQFSFGAFGRIMERGGVVMWPLLLCSLIALAVVLERLWVFAGCSLRERLRGRAVDTMCGELAAGRVDAAVAAGPGGGPVARVLAQGLQHRECGLGEGIEEAGQQFLSNLKRRLAVLDTIITLAPMLGILGTVTGIISSFQLLGDGGGAADAASVSAGIAEALITTAAGLVVSISTLVPFNMYRAQVVQWARRIEHAGRRCEAACARGNVDAD